MEETETLNSEIVMERAESIGGTSFLGAEITDVFWERINLFMDVCVSFDSELSDDTELEFFAVNRSGRAGARLHVVKKSGNKYRISMNITNVGDCSPIAAGNYYIAVCCGRSFLGYCHPSEELMERLKSVSRSFLYKNRMASFIVEFLRNDERDGELQPMTMLVMAGYAIPAGSVVESSSDSLENLIM